MSNEHRLLILCRLIEGEMSVGELERQVGLSQSALSQHLARLRRLSLVRTRRAAQTIFYSLNGAEAPAVLMALHALFCDPCDGGIDPPPASVQNGRLSGAGSDEPPPDR